MARKRVNKTCSQCAERATAKGLCGIHYADSRKHILRPSSGIHNDLVLPERKPYEYLGDEAALIATCAQED